MKTKTNLEYLQIKFIVQINIYKYSFISSSLTADGDKIPKSVNNSVIYTGGV